MHPIACASALELCSFDGLSIATFSKLYAFLVRSRFEYSNPAVFPFATIDMKYLELMQRHATRLGELRGISYKDRLRLLKLFPVNYRRPRMEGSPG